MLAEDDDMWTKLPGPTKLRIDCPMDTISLADLFRDDAPTLSREAKIHLAVLLAYSMLNLRNGPWLPQPWDNNKIIFLRSDEKILLRPHVPYIPSPSQIILDDTGDEHYLDLERRALGILLLEIFLQQSVESLLVPGENFIDTDGIADAKFLVACDALEPDKYDWEGSDDYVSAIEACLDFQMNADGSDPDEESYRIFLCDQVIEPLERELCAKWDYTLEEVDDMLLSCPSFKPSELPFRSKKEESMQVVSSIPTEIRDDTPIHRDSIVLAYPPLQETESERYETDLSHGHTPFSEPAFPSPTNRDFSLYDDEDIKTDS